MTFTTSLDFDANHLSRDPTTHTAFGPYMWTRGWWLLLRTLSLPSITTMSHRWHWANRSIYPIWKRVVTEDKELSRKLRRIVRRALPFRSNDYLDSIVIPQPGSMNRPLR